MARNLYGCTSADFTLTESGRVVAGATATVWTARTGGTQVTDLTDLDGDPITLVTSDADGGIRFYGVDGDKDTYWLDTGTGARIAVRPVDLTGEIGPTPDLTIGTVTTGTAAATITGTDAAPVLNLTLPTAGANGVNTAAIQDGAVTPAKLATSGRFTFPTGAANGYGFTSGASHLSGTGTPEGVVTAAPGSTWLQTDSTTDVKGWIRWIKASGTGSTGWVAGAEADTGWRNVTNEMASVWNTTDILAIRRIGHRVTVVGRMSSTAGGTGWSGTLYTLPVGFRCKDYTAKGVVHMIDNSVHYVTFVGNEADTNLFQLNRVTAVPASLTAGANLSFEASFHTDPTYWPTSLPGSA